MGYLFINRYIPYEYLECNNEKEDEELRKLNTKNIQKIYRELNEKAGKSNPLGERNLVRSHNIRKFFICPKCKSPYWDVPKKKK